MNYNHKNGRLQRIYSDDDILKALKNSHNIQTGLTIREVAGIVGSSKRAMEGRLLNLYELGKVDRFRAGCWLYWIKGND